MYDLSLNYATSIFNPLLKVIIALLYVCVAYAFFRAGQGYGGKLKTVTTILLWMAVAGTIAAIFRTLGHGTSLGFNKAYSLKWFQSIGYVVQAMLFAWAAKKFLDVAKT